MTAPLDLAHLERLVTGAHEGDGSEHKIAEILGLDLDTVLDCIPAPDLEWEDQDSPAKAAGTLAEKRIETLLRAIASADGEDEAVDAIVALCPDLAEGRWANFVPPDGASWTTAGEPAEMARQIIGEFE